MKIDGTPKPQGSDARRFSVGKAAPKEGGKSFREALKKASAAPSEPAQPAPAPAAPANAASDSPAISSGKAKANPAAESASFADHMEMVKLRLKSGYYTGKNMDEALSDKLSGYFDELA